MLEEPLVGLLDCRQKLERDIEVCFARVEVGDHVRVSVGFRANAERRHECLRV